ncbi:Metallo-dependent phosphatase [Corynespora cassiicola Philippines]|uniref:Metallo-dependent phosphatase n=1 Tax=Corynespora cassiicola Philippines TaxID=1448308 RepID=A0A2T2NRJ5_CORCC|nr:Metallo-dependent phosphatase [Corynespora cassiicola Philippines]
MSGPKSRKTRIVCISDTHNQTPKLPKGDVLIHAGDLTNQGSYSELKKTVEWLEKTDFEAKIVVAELLGNHDITLDRDFYKGHGSSWRWPSPQDPEQNRGLLTESKSITYLENEAACIFLNSPEGPRTCFKVYGSPCTPKVDDWAFQYEACRASVLWDAIPSDAHVVVTHTPPKGHCDRATKDDRSGCEALIHALRRVRPMLCVFGHIHEARGVGRVQWNRHVPGGACQDGGGVEEWRDPGEGNNKQSLVDLTPKGGRPLRNSGVQIRSPVRDFLTRTVVGGQVMRPEVLQPGSLISTSSLEAALDGEAGWRTVQGGAIEYRQAGAPGDGSHISGGEGGGEGGEGEGEADVEGTERRETCMINAALLGPRTGGPKSFNKPVVVDISLPVWDSGWTAE